MPDNATLLDRVAGWLAAASPASWRRLSGHGAGDAPPHVHAWAGEGKFQARLHTGAPVLLALTLPGIAECDALRGPLSRAAAANPGVAFVWVNCARADAREFCRQRGVKQLPHLVLMHIPVARQLAQSSVQDSDVAQYVASVHAFKHDWSLYGFRCFLRSCGIDDALATVPHDPVASP